METLKKAKITDMGMIRGQHFFKTDQKNNQVIKAESENLLQTKQINKRTENLNKIKFIKFIKLILFWILLTHINN